MKIYEYTLKGDGAVFWEHNNKIYSLEEFAKLSDMMASAYDVAVSMTIYHNNEVNNEIKTAIKEYREKGTHSLTIIRYKIDSKREAVSFYGRKIEGAREIEEVG